MEGLVSHRFGAFDCDRSHVSKRKSQVSKIVATSQPFVRNVEYLVNMFMVACALRWLCVTQMNLAGMLLVMAATPIQP